MKGDKLVIREEHIRAAGEIARILDAQAGDHGGMLIVSIAGESGSGKSEIAASLASKLEGEGIKSIIIQQDDYFAYPPKTNEKMRRENIGHVGPPEVRLGLLDHNLEEIILGRGEIEKPLVIFEEDMITHESVSLEGVGAVIVEGTYTTILENVCKRVFIERSCEDTAEARQLRAREKQDEFLERVLKIEHEIIAPHRKLADIIVTNEYEVRMNDGTR